MKAPTLAVLSTVLTLLVHAEPPPTLPGTALLTRTGDLSAQMHQAALRDMDQRIADAPATRSTHWHRDLTSPEAYTRSIAPNREHLRRILGLGDQRLPVSMERFGDDLAPALVAQTSSFEIHQVRWPVLSGITGEGLLLTPRQPSKGFIVALPDADETPEQSAGLAPVFPAEQQNARRFAENGFTVLVPTLVDRSSSAAGDPSILMTTQSNREWIHRQAFHMGRTLIGYELQKIMAGIDWAEKMGLGPVGVTGYGEGGLLAFYAAAVDPRIRATHVSGYFKSRQDTWSEPLYRDLWGLLQEFGDAEIASLIAPRGLVISYRPEPTLPSTSLPPGQKSIAAPGTLTTPPFAEVQREFARIGTLVPETLQPRQLVNGEGPAAFAAFARLLGVDSPMALSTALPKDMRQHFEPAPRQIRQVHELNAAIQLLVRNSDRTRDAFFLHQVVPEFASIPWNYQLRFPEKSPNTFVGPARPWKQKFWDEILGRISDPLPPLNPQTRLAYDRPKWTGYEVTLDVGREGFAWGILLLPKDLKPGERRPVVVCQHGRHGLPAEVIESDKPAYQNFAARLADEGFIVLAPHNLYQKEETYRLLARKGHTVKATHWSVMLQHHQQWLSWLASLPQVDPQRIGFYGLSFGGESAMRLPPLLDGYALSICSGDFNDWTRKVASTHDRKSFMYSDEWEIACFGMGETFSYAELSYLIFPRPFMVERGHHDGVALDSWVASEYAKTRWFYDQFGLGDRTSIEFFNGGHAINGQGTFTFLRQHLHLGQ